MRINDTIHVKILFDNDKDSFKREFFNDSVEISCIQFLNGDFRVSISDSKSPFADLGYGFMVSIDSAVRIFNSKTHSGNFIREIDLSKINDEFKILTNIINQSKGKLSLSMDLRENKFYVCLVSFKDEDLKIEFELDSFCK